MSNRTLVILAVLAVVTTVSAVLVSRVSNRPRTASNEPTYLIQGLDPADVTKIIVRTSEETATLVRQGKRFLVQDKGNYPADVKQINDLITKCLDIRTNQFITDNPDNHEDLGVTEEEARYIVKFFKDDSLLTGVVIGQSKEQGQGSYIRLATRTKVYVTPESPWIRSRPMDYINQDLISVAQEDVNSVTVTSPEDQYTLKAPEQGQDAVLENLPAGKKLKTSDSNRVFRALTDLRFTDVKKKAAAGDGLSFDRQYVCKLDDSTVYTLEIAKKEDKTYLTCQAEFTEERPTKERRVESEEELKEKEAKLLADDKAKQFTAKHQGWVYEIADWKAKDLTKPLADLLEDKEEEPAEATTGPAEQPEQTKESTEEPEKQTEGTEQTQPEDEELPSED
jgi:hypothetical protein